MSVIYIALPVSLLLVLAAIAAFIWALKSGQLDDLETPSIRLLMDDEEVRKRSDDTEDDAPEGDV